MIADIALAVAYVVGTLAVADFVYLVSQRRRPVLDRDGVWRMPRPRPATTRIPRGRPGRQAPTRVPVRPPADRHAGSGPTIERCCRG